MKYLFYPLILSFFVCVLVFNPGGSALSDDRNIGSPVSVPPPLAGISPPQKKVPQSLKKCPLSIHTKSGEVLNFSVEIADDEEKRRIGMMFREYIEPDTGMLFIFEDNKERHFWMKNTLVSLDIIFIREDGVITHIQRNAEPLSLRLLGSGGPAKFALEIAGGDSDRAGINIGDRVSYTVCNDNGEEAMDID